LRGAKLEDLDSLYVWIGQVKVKNAAPSNEVINTQEKVLRQPMSVTHFVHKNWHILCSKKPDYSKNEYAYCIKWKY
jgi:hypothetical protein